MGKSLQEQIEKSRKVFEENKIFYSNHFLFLGKKSSILLNEETFIGLLNDHALYHGREIATVSENPIHKI